MAGERIPMDAATTTLQRWQSRNFTCFLLFVTVNLILLLVLWFGGFLDNIVRPVDYADYQKTVDFVGKFYSIRHSKVVPNTTSARSNKTVLIWTKWWGARWTSVQLKTFCPSMPECVFTADHQQIGNADAVVFHYKDTPSRYSNLSMPQIRLEHQYWVWFAMECPIVTRRQDLVSYSGIFNWTMTYRNDSDVSTAYGSTSLIYRQLHGKKIDPSKDYSLGKKKLVVWFVSNCYKYLPRVPYAKELIRHIRVDVFGRCGKVICKKKDFKCSNNVIKQYKFYLSLESYKCKEYITEKFWVNALENEVVPVVLGAPKADYERLAPPGSFIHVDDFESPTALAHYLTALDKDNEKYNEYFRWP